MPQLDEYDQLLVANPFADDSAIESSTNTLVNLTLDTSSTHPLRARSVSPSITIVDSEEETRPIPTHLVGLNGLASEVTAEEDRTATGADRASGGGSNIITHLICPNDSFAGVALRYGVSIAALRRANQLWPSDPIHLRTELLIPRGDTRPTKRKPRRVASMDAALHSFRKQPPDRSPDLIASSFVAARNIIFSVLPARLSLESLSSKTSASEDHELDDLQAARTRKIATTQAPFAEQGLELSVVAFPHSQYKRSAVPIPSQVPCSPTLHHRDLKPILPAGALRLQTNSSPPTILSERPSRSHPFAVRPVRTAQLEPEPTMELPVRRLRS